MFVRFTQFVEWGPTQWHKDQVRNLPDALAEAFIARKEAEAMPTPETATLPRYQTAVMPKPGAKPKPKGRK